MKGMTRMLRIGLDEHRSFRVVQGMNGMDRDRSFPTSPGLDAARLAEQRSQHLPDGQLVSGLRLEFNESSLETVLNYLRESAGLIIHVSSNVKMERTLDLCRDEPVSAAEALVLLKQALIEKGCTLIQKGRLLSIIRSQDVKKHWILLPEL